jgi:hypothetical protein
MKNFLIINSDMNLLPGNYSILTLIRLNGLYDFKFPEKTLTVYLHITIPFLSSLF